jgi:hypothetical protein
LHGQRPRTGGRSPVHHRSFSSRIVLEKAGFVRRGEDPADRRHVIVEPLPKKIEKDISPLFEPIARRRVKKLRDKGVQKKRRNDQQPKLG